MARIQIETLSKQYAGGQMAAVQSLSLDIADNRFVTLLGPSGCGKTTTLRLIAGYLRPDTGTIKVDGTLVSSPDGVTPPDKRGMGMVFQNYAVWPHKTVFENVAFGLQIRRLPAAQIRDKVMAMLDLVGLRGFDARLPGQLSGGQQQRVALARSLVVEPGILLLDEPLSNLDAKLRERMRGELKQIQRRTGITFVYVTHDQAEALALSDEIAVMHLGMLQQYGSPRDIYSRPANRVVADFMGQVNFVPARVVDGGTIAVEGGRLLPVTVPAGLTTGTTVDLAVRPENIRLAAGGANGSSIPGHVAELTFLGNMNEYIVATEKDGRLRVQTHPAELFGIGDAVSLVLDPRQCSVFARS
jgi:iron(III) transport system ATP-binding protein